MIDRGQIRGYETVTQTLRDAFKDAVARQGRGTRAQELRRALGITIDDEAPSRRRSATRKPAAKKRAARR